MSDRAASEPDVRTVKRAIAGDSAAFESIVYRYEKLVYGIAYGMFGNAEDAQDMHQEIWIKVYNNMKKCGDARRFKAWLCRLATNACIDEWRKRKGRETESLDVEPEDGAPLSARFADEGPTPEEAAVMGETRTDIKRAMAKLSPEERAIVILRDVRGFSYAEIAAITDANTGTVKSRLWRARNRLRALYVGGAPEGGGLRG